LVVDDDFDNEDDGAESTGINSLTGLVRRRRAAAMVRRRRRRWRRRWRRRRERRSVKWHRMYYRIDRGIRNS
jgi:hypothetical protein